MAHGGRQRSGLLGAIFSKDVPVLESIPLGDNYAVRPDTPSHLPLPPPPKRSEVVRIFKRRREALGVRFHADDGDGGAQLESVEPYGLAWRHGLKWGDTISAVRTLNNGRESKLTCGEDAARALRPAYGQLELIVRPRFASSEDRSASLIQSVILGVFCRDTLRVRAASATVISAHWRRWCAIMDLRALQLDAEEDRAVAAIQGAWRTRIRRWERKLALDFLQHHARNFIGRARKRRCIRAPPMLLDEL